jgi:hypothetical protein
MGLIPKNREITCECLHELTRRKIRKGCDRDLILLGNHMGKCGRKGGLTEVTEKGKVNEGIDMIK